jgi:hypothetical protein
MQNITEQVKLAHDFKDWLKSHPEISVKFRHTRKYLFQAFMAGRKSAQRDHSLITAATIQRVLQPSMN